MIYINNIPFEDDNYGFRMLKLMEQPYSWVSKRKYDITEGAYNSLEPLKAPEILAQSNSTIRELGLKFLNPKEIIEQLGAEIVDKQTIHKKNTRYKIDESGELIPYIDEIQDVYELYKIPIDSLIENSWRSERDVYVYSIKCSCTTTGKEYYLWALTEPVRKDENAITAIASTYKFPVFNDKSIHITKCIRHGDVLFYEINKSIDCKPDSFRPMTKQEYLTIIESET